MKKQSLVMIALAVLTACSKDERPSPTAAASQNVTARREGVDNALRKDSASIRKALRVLALATVGIKDEPLFNSTVNQAAENTRKSQPGSDYYVTYPSLASRYDEASQQAGILRQKMIESLTNNGGSTEDAETLALLINGSYMTNSGVRLTPGIRQSYRDGQVSLTGNHNYLATPQLGSLYNVPTWENTSAGLKFTNETVNVLDTNPTWTINLLLTEGGDSEYLYSSIEDPSKPPPPKVCRYSNVTYNCWPGGSEARCTCDGSSSRSAL